MNGLLEKGQEKVEAFIRDGVEVWTREERLDQPTADSLLASLSTPEVTQGLVHAGAHFAISLPLRFPLGAMARFFYTLTLRLRAEASGLLHHQRPAVARRLHTLPVMLFALLPGFGRLAYFFCPALVRERLLLVIPLDQVSRKLPFKAYQRLHMDALYVYWAEENSHPGGLRRFSPGRLASSVRARFGELSDMMPFIAGVLAVDVAAFAVGAYIYFDSPPVGEWWDRSGNWWFMERGVIASLDTLQLVVAGVAGIAAYNLFWRRADGASKAEAFGIFLWGIGGAGLVFFAIEDFFTVHETLGNMFTSILPGGLNDQGDVFILAYAVVSIFVLYVFHTELTAERGSTSLLILAAVAAIVMVGTDAFGKALFLHALELPVQTLASSLLMLAFLRRYYEVRDLATSTVSRCDLAVTR